ncbi:MAG: hypothetical protein ABH864_07190 [archaeon]
MKRSERNIKLKWILLVVALISLSSLTTSIVQYTPSNESIQAKQEIDKAALCLENMQARKIPTSRANESYQKALQLYSAQIALEEKGKKAEFVIVTESANEACKIKKISFETQDELKIFKQSFENAKEDSDLSAMDRDYEDILQSFAKERFEETIPLIDEAYKTMSEIQASQTTLKLFYDTTRKSIKKLFIENLKQIAIASIIVIILLAIFWKFLKKIKIKIELRNLTKQKQALNSLIKNLQHFYFEKKSLSESEFRVKLERFKEMIRDIDGQIPLLKEKIVLLDKKPHQNKKIKHEKRNK